jgi:hypothetical protein
MAEVNDFQKLESALIDAGHSIEYPATPNIAARVRANLNAGQDRRSTKSIFRSRPMLIAIAIVIALAVLIAIPQTREVLAQIFGLRHIEIVPVSLTPNATPIAFGVAPIDNQCCLTTLDKARSRARFGILLPPDGSPSQVFLQDQVLGSGNPGQQLILVFGDPHSPDFVLYESQNWFYEKAIDSSGSSIGSGTTISVTQVHKRRALWLSGAPHILVTLDSQGRPVIGTERPVNANTLIWDNSDGANGITYRLETTLGFEEAVKFAEALR